MRSTFTSAPSSTSTLRRPTASAWSARIARGSRSCRSPGLVLTRRGPGSARSAPPRSRQTSAKGKRPSRIRRGEIHEVRAEGDRQSFRVLFAQEGRGRVLLALEALSKKTQRTPPEAIRLAERRLADWRARAQKKEQTR